MFHTSTILAIQQPCDDVRVFDIAAPEGMKPFTVGSHIQIVCARGGQDTVRSYSLIGRPEDRQNYRIAVRLSPESHGGSKFMWTLAIGDKVSISAPRNEFLLSDRHVPRLLVAGGIGITPLFGMAYSLLAENKPFKMAYLGRSRGAMPFLQELERDMGERLLVHPQDALGIADLPALMADLPEDAEVYVCGPLSMLNAIKTTWKALGRADKDLRFENFGNTGLAPAQSFRVSVPRLGIDLEVPQNSSLLEILEQAGADPLFNCRKGECGLCAVQVLSYTDTIDHRDVFFSEHQKAENAAMCACVSRVTGGSLVIELP